jgi:hypothetical protein
MDTAIIDKVIEELKSLPQDLQCRVLEFTRMLAHTSSRGVQGKQLLRFAGAIPLEDVSRMSEAIEQNCEQVDANEW